MSTMISDAVGELVPLVAVKPARSAVGVPQASYYRVNPAGEATEPTELPASEPAARHEQRAPQQGWV